MSKSEYAQNMEFEAEVRRIAEAIWGLEPGACQPKHYADDAVIRELDGIARLRDVTHLLMVTTSTRLSKVKSDVKKLRAAESKEKTRAQAVSKWLITRNQLDAEHIEHARKENVTTLTLDAFRRRFFDGRKYINLRNKAAFGSARNPVDDSVEFAADAYVPLPIRGHRDPTNNQRHGQLKESSHFSSIERIAESVVKGETFVLVAPFGGGKSLTTRELFRHLTTMYLSGETNTVPVALNLREHWGQEYFDEVLERHARSIGYSPKEDLVVAWRAGMISLLIDGFDEVASQTVVRRDDVNFMRTARHKALTGARDFLSKMPKGAGVWICGRDHYFDSIHEMRHALGLGNRPITMLRLDEFTEEGANDYLRRQGIDRPLPDWLPRKPLLLGYHVRT